MEMYKLFEIHSINILKRNKIVVLFKCSISVIPNGSCLSAVQCHCAEKYVWILSYYSPFLGIFSRWTLKWPVFREQVVGRSNLPCGHSCLPQPHLIVIDNMLNVNSCLFSKNVHYISSYCSFSSNTHHLSWAEMVWLVKVIKWASITGNWSSSWFNNNNWFSMRN